MGDTNKNGLYRRITIKSPKYDVESSDEELSDGELSDGELSDQESDGSKQDANLCVYYILIGYKQHIYKPLYFPD
jgi:hypothetical protein